MNMQQSKGLTVLSVLFALAFPAFSPATDRAAAEEASGRVTCTIQENGEEASGVVSVQREGKEVASGSCGKELSLPAGTYIAVLGLDGALDGPEQQKPLTVKKGETARLDANFATGILEVRIASQGKRAAGMAIIKRDGKQIGTLGSGVAAHLSAGTYEVVARHRTQEKAFGAVSVPAGQRITLDAAFE
jgi:hypothetical protein